MSKKQKRSVTSNTSVDVETVQSAASAAPVRRFSAATAEFNPDYSHVIAGLKRIAGLVAFFVVAMIVLTFIIK